APPLRSARDRDALRAALRDGVIDCIATDHAPHTDIEKDQPFDQAPPGMIGLEFAFALLFTDLVAPGHLPLTTLIQRMTAGPARIIGIPRGTLRPGSAADAAVLDLHAATEVTPARLHSKSKNTPFLGRVLSGAVTHTIVDGKLVFDHGVIVAGNAAGARA
ncbi:MAG: amidohydrolase family protein, partial [Candidatus Sumerlaeia bacterium]|nr:amidohydrolase family protein [Candidatus Sumerlaeia bacterium]